MRGNSASLGSRIHVAPVTAHRPKPSKAESAAAAQRARATARRALLLVVTVAVAVNLSYIMEHATSYLMSFYAEPEDRGDLIRYEDTPPEVVTYATLATRAPVISGDWDPSKIEEQVPVVFYYAKPGVPPCHRVHYTYKPVEQARRLNELVYFIGPEECRHFYPKMGVRFEHFSEYEDVYEWFQRNVGQPVDNHMRWFILKRFMEKHQYTRVFYAASEVMLYANITELAAFQYPKSDIVLPVRWPSLRPPLRPNQYVSTAVAGHAALFSYEGLADWCLFLHTVFRLQLFGGDPAAHPLVLMPQYNDMVPMGWYTFAECWMQGCLGVKGTARLMASTFGGALWMLPFSPHCGGAHALSCARTPGSQQCPNEPPCGEGEYRRNASGWPVPVVSVEMLPINPGHWLRKDLKEMLFHPLFKNHLVRDVNRLCVACGCLKTTDNTAELPRQHVSRQHEPRQQVPHQHPQRQLPLRLRMARQDKPTQRAACQNAPRQLALCQQSRRRLALQQQVVTVESLETSFAEMLVPLVLLLLLLFVQHQHLPGPVPACCLFLAGRKIWSLVHVQF
eukprot:jgi/Mesen1/6950/ME000360S06218